MTKKEMAEARRRRAKAELTLRVIQFVDNFKSKEEPSIKLNLRDKTEVLSELVTRAIPRLLNPKK